ncbi:hypothetical protein OsI_34910 [Oryza sativa Indica Group]|uniref:Ubiquitin-like protease family profile domain-containing protein n=1 Tax=Oryza sativa subsp. indica TaxID=39946 RepID=B8BIT1_ORYSI|nr:hypothetical protein OsI_34910 [Oryza sativa Indica Group]
MLTDGGTLPQDQGGCSIDATASIIHASSSPERLSHDPSAAANPALSASAQEYTEEGAQPLTGCHAGTAGQGNDDQQTIDPARVLENTTPQPTQVIVPVIHHNHWTLYCVNRNHGRIDVFDSNNYPALNTEYKDHHGDLGRRVVKQLSDRLYAAARTAFKRFGNQKLVRNKCPVMLKPNDCAFFVMRYMELYDGDDSPLIQVAESEEYNDLRSQMLYYMVFHSKNVAAPLPLELEEL